MRPLTVPVLLLALAAACGTPGTMPMKADLSGAALTLGPGRLPGGTETPAPSGFRPTVAGLISLVPAYKTKDIPELKVWSVPLENQRAYFKGVSPGDPTVGGKELKVTGQSFIGQGALMQFEATWEGPAEGRFLVVELWRKGSRLAVAASSLELHYLPAAQPRGAERN
ncbi:MAG TPA: hypothetical protein VJ600_08860 [Holophagaceae bacterium]|nr:hypothetical protein [Holophagaceae bacterium]